MKYNLIRNGYFSGSGDHIFTWSDLEKLQDGNTTTSGVTISGVNDLVVDLNQRIKVDAIRLYASDLTKSSNIYFWYKNNESDPYIQIPTNVSSYYYTTIPLPSAPRYIKATISGVLIDIYELYVENDDYIVAYGQDGQQYAEYLENTPVGEEGAAQAIAIYNNSEHTMPANAYTCIEATGSGYDNYIKISSSENGTYYKIEDGVIINTNVDGINKFRWSDGTFSNTAVNAENNVYTLSNTVDLDYGDIPLTYKNNSWSVSQSCWDYDPITRTIYAIGAETTIALKLYKMEIDVGTWEYVGEINNGVTGFTYFASMCYMNGYVYVACRLDGTHFGRYDVNGPLDNWEPLSNIGWSVTPWYMGMCSDKNRYIYMIHYYGLDNSHREFRRYDTVTDSWTSLNMNYSNNNIDNTNYARRASLTYDYDRDYIYADIGGYNIGDYIQRYDVGSNSWYTTWFNVDNYTGESDNPAQTINYYNNILVLGFRSTGTKLYYYRLDTGVISYFNVSTSFYSRPMYGASPIYTNPFILITDANSTNNVIGTDLSIDIYRAQIDGDIGGVRLLSVNFNKAGTYLSPIFSMEDKDMSSYFIIDGTTDPSTGSISYDDEVYNGTIKVRSSDIDPLPIFESYFAACYYLGSGSYEMRIYRWSPFNNSYTTIVANDGGTTYYSDNYAYGLAANSNNGKFVMTRRSGTTSDASRLTYYNRDGSLIAYKTYQASSEYNKYSFNKFLEFDGFNCIWGYSDTDYSLKGRTLRRLNETDLSDIVEYHEGGLDFVYSMTTEFVGGGCWYTNSIEDILVHMSPLGIKLQVAQLPLPLATPRWLCKTTDNGCWVHDSTNKKLYRYNSSGNISNTIDLNITNVYGDIDINYMSDDRENGVWFRHDDLIYHMTSDGLVDTGPILINNAGVIRGTKTVCFVHDTVGNKAYCIIRGGGVSYSRSVPEAYGLFGSFYYDYDTYTKYKYKYIPVSYDPVWGGSSTLEWNEVRKDGYFLPKNKYHQVDIKLLWGATLDGIYMAPAIKTEDIRPQQSKNIYVKTDIPLGADISDYELKLRTWWGVEDV